MLSKMFSLSQKSDHITVSLKSFSLPSLPIEQIQVRWLSVSLELFDSFSDLCLLSRYCLGYLVLLSQKPPTILIPLAKPIQVLLHSECPRLQLMPCFALLHTSFLSMKHYLLLSLTFALSLHAFFLHQILSLEARVYHPHNLLCCDDLFNVSVSHSPIIQINTGATFIAPTSCSWWLGIL